MFGLLQLIQREGDWAGPQPAEALLAVLNVAATHQRPVYQSVH